MTVELVYRRTINNRLDKVGTIEVAASYYMAYVIYTTYLASLFMAPIVHYLPTRPELHLVVSN